MILFFRRKMKDDLPQKNIWKYDIFFKCSERMVFPKKSHWNMTFPVSSEKMAFLFLENMIFSLVEMKDDLSQKIHGNMVFSVYSVKMVFLFPTNMELPFCQKGKDYLLLKITYENGIYSIFKKGDAHPRKDDIGILD